MGFIPQPTLRVTPPPIYSQTTPRSPQVFVTFNKTKRWTSSQPRLHTIPGLTLAIATHTAIYPYISSARPPPDYPMSLSAYLCSINTNGYPPLSDHHASCIMPLTSLDMPPHVNIRWSIQRLPDKQTAETPHRTPKKTQQIERSQRG